MGSHAAQRPGLRLARSRGLPHHGSAPDPVPAGAAVPPGSALLYRSQPRLRDTMECIPGLVPPSLSSLSLARSPSWCWHVFCSPSNLTLHLVVRRCGRGGCPPHGTHSLSLSEPIRLRLWWHVLLPCLCVQLGTYNLAQGPDAPGRLWWRTDHFCGARRQNPRRLTRVGGRLQGRGSAPVGRCES